MHRHKSIITRMRHCVRIQRKSGYSYEAPGLQGWFPPWTVLGWQANISPASSRRPGSAPLGDSRSPAASPGNPNVAPGESKQLAHMESRCPGTENGRSIRCTAPARSARPTRTSVRSRMREASYRVGYRAGSNTTSTEPSQIWTVESG